MDVSYQVINRVPISKEETQVSVRINIYPRTNGFEQELIQFAVKTKTMAQEVKDRVIWKLRSMIGDVAEDVKPVEVERETP